MIRTININLPYDDDTLATIDVAGKIYQKSVEVGMTEKINNKYALNKRLYYELKDQFQNCPAAVIQQTIFGVEKFSLKIKRPVPAFWSFQT